jgi:LmbE family N-acetylglucosaminyl deacetylase
MEWIYLSPHFDDVALSVGGLLWEQSRTGERVSVWTICGGEPPSGDYSPFAASLHTRWQTGAEAIQARRVEDIKACQRLGARYMHFDIPDCIYRRSPKTGDHLYASEEALWIPVHPDEEELIGQLAEQMQSKIPPGANIVCPLTLGDHVDHRLTRAAAERLGTPLWFYADYPYLLEADNLKALEKRQSMITSISPQGLLAWQEAVATHGSQISTFWENLDEMRAAIKAYSQKMGGVKLFTGKSQNTLT